MFLYVLLCLVHIVICVALVFFILIQSNKGMGLSGAFGAVGGSDSIFGSSGSLNMLVKISLTLSVLFALTSLALTVFPPPRSELSLVGGGSGAATSVPVAPVGGETTGGGDSAPAPSAPPSGRQPQ